MPRDPGLIRATLVLTLCAAAPAAAQQPTTLWPHLDGSWSAETPGKPPTSLRPHVDGSWSVEPPGGKPPSRIAPRY